MKARNHPKVRHYLACARDYLKLAVTETNRDIVTYLYQRAESDVKLARSIFMELKQS